MKLDNEMRRLSEEVQNSGIPYIVKDGFSNNTFVITASSKEVALKKLFKYQKSRIPQKTYEEYIKEQKPKIKEAPSRGGVIEIINKE